MKQLLFVASACLAGTAAHAQLVPMYGTSIPDISGNKVIPEAICPRPISATNDFVEAEIGDRDQVIWAPVRMTITNGAFSTTLAHVVKSSPANTCYSRSVTSTKGFELGSYPLFRGVEASVVETWAASNWCTAAAGCDMYMPQQPNVDTVLPTQASYLAAGLQVTQGLQDLTEPSGGPAGPTEAIEPIGPQGTQGIAGAIGLVGTTSATGSVGAPGAPGATGSTGAQGAAGAGCLHVDTRRARYQDLDCFGHLMQTGQMAIGYLQQNTATNASAMFSGWSGDAYEDRISIHTNPYSGMVADEGTAAATGGSLSALNLATADTNLDLPVTEAVGLAAYYNGKGASSTASPPCTPMPGHPGFMLSIAGAISGETLPDCDRTKTARGAHSPFIAALSSTASQNFTGPISVPNGSAAAPSVSSTAGDGLMWSGTVGDWGLSAHGAEVFRALASSTADILPNTWALGWGSSGAGVATPNLCLWSGGAATLFVGSCTTGNSGGTIRASVVHVSSDVQAAFFISAAYTITSSAAPVINPTLGGLQTITLSANAVPTTAGLFTGSHVTLEICQPAAGGPYTWTWPSTVHGGMTVGTTAGDCSIQSFDSFSATDMVAESTGVANVAP